MTSIDTAVIERVCAVVDDLNKDNADEVAAYLRDRGITGVRKDESCCAIANLIRKVDGVGFVEVDGVSVYLAEDALPEDRIDLPLAAQAFVVGFDRCRYPDLIATPAVTW